jgi:hypothetical protein
MTFLDNDVQSLLKRVKALENLDVDAKLIAAHKHLLNEVRTLITSSQKSLASNLLDVILSEDKTAIKQLQAELSATASSAARSAEIAQQYASTELTMSIELLRSKSYHFSHSEG